MKSKKKLRKYQREAIQAIYDYFMEMTGNPLIVIGARQGSCRLSHAANG